MARAVQKKDLKVADRWTVPLSKSFTPIVQAFIENCGRRVEKNGLGLSPTQAMIIIQLMSFKWDNEMPFPAIGTIATRLGVAPTTVRNNIDAMVKKKLVVKRLKRGFPSSYDLRPLFDRLEVIQKVAEERNALAKAEAAAMRHPEFYDGGDDHKAAMVRAQLEPVRDQAT